MTVTVEYHCLGGKKTFDELVTLDVTGEFRTLGNIITSHKLNANELLKIAIKN